MTEKSENESTAKSTNESKIFARFIIGLLVLSIWIVLICSVVRYLLFKPPARVSAIRQTTTQPVPFDAERREQIRDFVADEIYRQVEWTLQMFDTVATTLITTAATLIAVAVAIFGINWWRQTREHKEIIDRAEKYSQEIEQYREAIKADVNAIAENRKKSEKSFQQTRKKFIKAQKLYKKMVNILSNAEEAAKWAEAERHFTQALTCYNKGDLDRAIEEFTKSIAAKKTPEAYNNRGTVWADKGEFDKAIADYNKAIELNPKDAQVYNNRGTAWAKKSEFDKAIDDFNRAIELNPKDAGAYYNRGLAWGMKRELDKAIADFDKAIELDPKNAGYYLRIANALIALRDFPGAIERLRQGRNRNAFENDRDRLIASCLEGIALALSGQDASAAETKAKQLQVRGVRASDWDTEPIDRFLNALNPEDFAPGAVETARRFQEMLKSEIGNS